MKKRPFFLIWVFWQILTGCCPLTAVYFNNMQINRWQIFKDTFFTEHFGTTASETHRVSFLRSFFFCLWINLFCFVADISCRNFLKLWQLICRKLFSAFYPDSHETFSIVSLLCKNLIFFLLTLALYDRKHFCSTLTEIMQYL